MAESLQLPHKLTLLERSSLSMTGVTEVVSFDESAVVLHTALGTLTVLGSGLQMKDLSVEGGVFTVEGTVNALSYEDPKPTGGWISRLLR